MSTYQLRQISSYPIKSTQGQDHSEITVGLRGLGYDRHWALVGQNGMIMTGREYPELMDFRASIRENQLVVEWPGAAAAFSWPIDQYNEEVLDVRFFDKNWQGQTVSAAADAWFTQQLGIPCQLLYVPPSLVRAIPARHGGRPGDEVAFPDQAPLLLFSEASLADLNQRLDQPIGSNRFRPNIIVKDGTSFMEDQWKYIRIGECEFQVTKACKRCVFTTIDPLTKQKHPQLEPIKTLSTYRKVEGGIAFGIYLIPRKFGRIQLQDQLEVLQ